MKPLIDADVLRYEIGHCAQYEDEDGREVIRDFAFAAELLDGKISSIVEYSEADEKSCLYLTSSEKGVELWNQTAKYIDREELEHEEVFRHALATVKPYKARKSDKPYHFDNLTAYMINNYDCKMACGIEADDLMAMDQTKDTIICSRDKDLRQVPGLHYSWECGKQPEVGPIKFTKKGFVEPRGADKVFGGGEMFFLYQLLAGDTVDNIPGCPKVGRVKALAILGEGGKRKEVYSRIADEYFKVYDVDWKERINEQGRLLWLKRTIDDMWEYPY